VFIPERVGCGCGGGGGGEGNRGGEDKLDVASHARQYNPQYVRNF